MLAFSVLYWAFFLLTLPFMFVPAVIIWALTKPWDRRLIVLHYYTSLWGCLYIYANPLWKVRVAGRRRIPWGDSVIIVSNHASLIDILVLFALYRPFKWVSKVENFKMPFIGWNMSLNDYVPLVRGDRASVVEMLDRCRTHLRNRSSVLIFPEGTRSETDTLRPFKDGAFQLAIETGRPVLPVAVSGTGASLPKHGLVLRRGMDARVNVLEPLNPRDFDSVDSLRDAAYRVITDALDEPGPAELGEAV